MKKKFIGTLAVLAVAAMAAFNVSINSEENFYSNLTPANIEALAQNEGSGCGCCDTECIVYPDGWAYIHCIDGYSDSCLVPMNNNLVLLDC